MWRIIIFAVLVPLVWGGMHAYVGWSLGRYLRDRKRSRWALWAALAVNFAVTVAASVLRRTAPDALGVATLQWVAYIGMGAFALLIGLVIVRDLLWLIARGSTRLKATVASAEADAPADPSRREFFANTVNSSLMGVTALGAGFGYQQARKLAEVVEVDVPVEGLAADLEGFRIVQVSDIHVGPTIKRPYLERVVERVNGLDPDLIAITGDMVDGFVEDMRSDVAPIGDFRATHGAYFVTGNHEYYWDGPAWCEEVERCGLTVLNNEHRVVEVGGARLIVGGATDYRAERHVPEHASDPHRALEGAPEADFRLLLAHQPKTVWEASKAGFDLQLSGHTHGGQFWPWSLFVGLAHPFTRGLNDYESMKIYVSCGTGYWGPPMRLGVPSEITLLRLVRA